MILAWAVVAFLLGVLWRPEAALAFAAFSLVAAPIVMRWWSKP